MFRSSMAQLARTACERLFCSLSAARIGVSCRRSRLQVAVGSTPKWTAICSRLLRQDSGRQLPQLSNAYTGSGRPAAIKHMQLQCRVLANGNVAVSSYVC